MLLGENDVNVSNTFGIRKTFSWNELNWPVVFILFKKNQDLFSETKEFVSFCVKMLEDCFNLNLQSKIVYFVQSDIWSSKPQNL